MSSTAPQFRSRMPRLAEAAVDRVRLTVVPRRRQRAAKVPFVTLVSMLMLGGVVGLLLFNTSMQQASFAATSLKQQADNLSAREQTLKMELDTLRDPQRVALRAEALGMVPATAPAFLDLRSDRILGTPTVAGAAEGLRIRPYPVPLPRHLVPKVTVVEVPAPSARDPKSRADTGATSREDRSSTGRNE